MNEKLSFRREITCQETEPDEQIQKRFFFAMRETHRYNAVVYHVDQLHKVLGRARARREQLPRGIVEQSCGYVVGFVR